MSTLTKTGSKDFFSLLYNNSKIQFFRYETIETLTFLSHAILGVHTYYRMSHIEVYFLN